MARHGEDQEWLFDSRRDAQEAADHRARSHARAELERRQTSEYLAKMGLSDECGWGDHPGCKKAGHADACQCICHQNTPPPGVDPWAQFLKKAN